MPLVAYARTNEKPRRRRPCVLPLPVSVFILRRSFSRSISASMLRTTISSAPSPPHCFPASPTSPSPPPLLSLRPQNGKNNNKSPKHASQFSRTSSLSSMSILTPVSPSDHHRSDHPQPPKRYASPPSTAAHRHRRRHHRPVLISHFSTSDPRLDSHSKQNQAPEKFVFQFLCGQYWEMAYD